MSVVPLSTEAVGVQHSVSAGNNIAGDQPDNGDAVFDLARQVLVHPEEAGGGGGYFRPADSLLMGDNHAFVTRVHVLSTAGFNWTINVTSGFGDGVGLDGDAPLFDATLASGSDSASVLVNLELLPGQAIRVTTSGATTAVFAIVHFSETSGDHGRMNA